LKTQELVKKVLLGSLKKWFSDDIPMHGAALAFYTIFSLAPILFIALSSIAWVYDDYTAMTQLRQLVENYLNPELATTVISILEEIDIHPGLTMPIIGGITLVFASTTAIAQLKSTLNSIWKVKTKEGKGVWQFIVDRALSLVLVLSITLILAASVTIDALLYTVTPLFESELPFNVGVTAVLNEILLWTSTYVLFYVILKMLPDVSIPWKEVAFGALITTVLFMLGKWIIGWYLASFVSYDVFGAAGTFVVLLIWVYYNAQVIFLGAECIQVYMQLKNRQVDAKRFATMELPT
jgi:membrane protein